MTTLTLKEEGNQLFPIFLKLNTFRVLLVGAGNVGLEKLSAMLRNSPEATITVVAQRVLPEIFGLTEIFPQLQIQQKSFAVGDLDSVDLVIVATNDPLLNEYVRSEAKARKLLVNVADKPELCDFYLGAIVKKGDLKLAISTNGKSPTVAKRLKEFLNEQLPDELDETLQNMNKLRMKLNGDFADKVKTLNKATALMVEEPRQGIATGISKRLVTWGLGLIIFALAFSALWFFNEPFRSHIHQIDHVFYYFLGAGFVFAMVDGAIGMSYGVTSTTFSLSMGIPPASASAAVHVSEILSNGIAGWMHYRMGNINKRLFWLLVIPGLIGAVTGAYLLSSLEHYSQYTKPLVSLYTLILGGVILSKAFQLKRKGKRKAKFNKIVPLGLGGGFIDAVGGGGWGSIVLSTLIAGGRNARYSMGTVKLSRAFIAIASSITFFTMLGGAYWEAIAGLLIGSAIASPIAARVSNKLSAKTIMIAVGIIVIAVSLKSITSFLLKVL